jgi:hypothetical protein
MMPGADVRPGQKERIMMAFLTAAVVAIVIAIGAAFVLESSVQVQADQALVTTSGARIPDHGDTHNLVGKGWFSPRD